MNALLRALRRLPTPVKLLAAAAVLLLAVALVGSVNLKGMVGFLALACWIAVLVALLCVVGPLTFLRTVPGVGAAIGAITNPVQSVGPGGQSVESQGEHREPDPKEREELLVKAMAALDELKGVDNVKEQLNRDLVAVIEREAALGEIRFGTDAPVVALFLFGPSGSGKTDFAQQIAPLFAGYGAVKRPISVTVHRGDLFQGYSSGTERVAEFVEHAADGVLILDDADWLVEANKMGDSAGVDFGRELYRHCVKRHGKRPAVIVATLSGDAGHRLSRSKEHRSAWLNKVSDHWFEFPNLEEDVLLSILNDALADRGLALEVDAESAASSYARSIKRRQGVEFDNAISMRRIADQLVRISAQEGRSSVTPSDFAALEEAY